VIAVKTPAEIETMKLAGGIVNETLELLRGLVKPGVSTEWLDREAEAFIRSKGAIPSFLNYNGYPKSICVSINEQVVHGIPGSRVIRDGDVVSVDVGAYIEGYHGDAARTFLAGEVPDDVKRLVRVTRECFFQGVKFAKPGFHISDISAAVQKHAEDNGYTVVRELVGHGIGKKMHEDPEVPNFTDRRRGSGAKLTSGMVIAIEPMINLGGREVVVLRDGWTVETRDKMPSAHYENTVAVTDGEPLLLTWKEREPDG
jgi:methionyl aminopeptidase